MIAGTNLPARFVGNVLAWLPLAFAVWYFGAPVLLWPVKLLLEGVVAAGFGGFVTGIEQSAATITFATWLKPGDAIRTSAQVIVDVNGLLYTFGMPMFAALVLAAKEPHRARRLAVGYAVQLPFVAWGVVADFLKSVAVTSGALVASQAGFAAWQREAIAFAYQFGSLILPTVVPAVTWVLMHRAFLERWRRT